MFFLNAKCFPSIESNAKENLHFFQQFTSYLWIWLAFYHHRRPETKVILDIKRNAENCMLTLTKTRNVALNNRIEIRESTLDQRHHRHV